MDKLLIFSGNSNLELAKEICEHLGIELGKTLVSRFSDGEIRVKIEENVRGKDIFVIQSTCAPVNENLMELLIMLDALKRASAWRVTAVIPYFGYARQDRKDQPRVPITAKLVANLLTEAGASRVLTLDLHAGQLQGFFDIPLDHLYAIEVFYNYFKEIKLEKLVIVSPDVGGIKMARAYAKKFSASLAIVDKRRDSPDSTEVMHILGEVKNKNVILVDDIISTGSSLVEAAKALKENGAGKIFSCVTHGVLSSDAVKKIESSCIDYLVITNSIPLSEEKKTDKIKVVSVGKLFAEAIKRIHKEESISVLFDSIRS
ncbi:MAG: ribose-phosphate pyrophosphokinase [Candidatus Omnitrophica bacterium]|nr:ribose-phosphate pyrophosphokinase [Candidatus Omnitrophota bacterium]MCM8826194.1 ribose-phosphate pyrophosphokinase [Candidatus Omnitrophota bacterium]